MTPTPGISDLDAGDLRIEVSGGDGAPIRAVWRGKSIERYPGKVLDPFLGGLLDNAKQHQVALELHFARLELFNSSTITSIIQAIQDARERGVKLAIVYDPAIKWQKLSFDALRVFATDDGLIELRTS